MHQIKEVKSTLEDLMALPEDDKAELINGVIYMMAPAAAKHSVVCSSLTAKIITHVKNKSKGPKDPDGCRIIAEAWTDYGLYNSFVHDLAAFSRRDLPQLPDLGPIMATPIWVCEILSLSNWSNDTQRKRVVLEKHRVPYYWLVDPIRKTIQVFELRENNEHYQIVYAADDGAGVLKLPSFNDLDLFELFNY